jgi:hypothetical protein
VASSGQGGSLNWPFTRSRAKPACAEPRERAAIGRHRATWSPPPLSWPLVVAWRALLLKLRLGTLNAEMLTSVTDTRGALAHLMRALATDLSALDESGPPPSTLQTSSNSAERLRIRGPRPRAAELHLREAESLEAVLAGDSPDADGASTDVQIEPERYTVLQQVSWEHACLARN